jgi:CO/xanthine dehydrogenase Mo-binding subunit
VIRSDATAKIRGAAEFGTDLHADGMLWGALVLAPVAHGRIRRLDLAPARAVPGVVVALGAEEVRALLPSGGGDPERPIFPPVEILYRGQPIAAIAAESYDAARAGVAAVGIEVEPLPIVHQIEELFPEWPDHPEGSDRVIAHVQARHGDLEGCFRDADLVVSDTFRTSGIAQVALEPHACLAEVKEGRWKVRSSTQAPFAVREDLSALLGIPEAEIVVEGSWVGGGFGGKASSLLEGFALVLARAAGRPVKLALRYREEFQLARSTLPAVFRLETAVRGGRMTARRVRTMLDSGASLPGRDFATGYSMGFLLGPYRFDAFAVEGIAIRTHKVPFGPHRAPLAPQCVFAAESHVDGIARKLGVDPIEFRERHAWKEGDTTMFGQPVGPIGLPEALRRARELATRWRTTLPEGNGIGIGVGFWSTSTGAGGEARLRLTPERLYIEEGERDIGSGSVSRGLAAVVERILGLPTDRIELRYQDTHEAPFDSGVFGSRTLGALGQAVQKASESLQRTLAQRMGGGAASETIRIRPGASGELEVHGGGGARPLRTLLLTEAERSPEGLVALGKHYGGGAILEETRIQKGEFYPYTDFTATVHLAEVSVDRETGQVRPVRCVGFQDVGVVVDPEMFRAQVEGAVAMGLGEALTEETLWSDEARLLNPYLLDYRIPAAGEVPPIEAVAIEGFLGAGPFGAKGLGEPPIIPVPAAIANAIADATGARPTELPMTAERVARALKLLGE